MALSFTSPSCSPAANSRALRLPHDVVRRPLSAARRATRPHTRPTVPAHNPPTVVHRRAIVLRRLDAGRLRAVRARPPAPAHPILRPGGTAVEAEVAATPSTPGGHGVVRGAGALFVGRESAAGAAAGRRATRAGRDPGRGLHLEEEEDERGGARATVATTAEAEAGAGTGGVVDDGREQRGSDPPSFARFGVG